MKLNLNCTKSGNIYGRWQIAENTWCITDHWQNFIYLLLGEKRAMLIDSCSGEGNIREVVEEITDKPVMVVNTHGHFDHTGGNSCWAEAWMTPEAAIHAKSPFSKIHKKWFESKLYPDYTIHFLRDGEVIDLGNRIVEVLAIPAHSEGSIALLDSNTRSLFCGDELDSGQVIWFVRNKAVPITEIALAHKGNMEKLISRRSDYEYMWPAHNGMPLHPDVYLRDFIELDKRILKGIQETLPDTAGFGFPQDNCATPNQFMTYGKLTRAQYGLASIIYSEVDSIYHND